MIFNSVKNYLKETNVQLGATYNVAKQSTDSYGKGIAAAARFMSAEEDEIGTLYLLLVPSILYSSPMLISAIASNRPLNDSAILKPLPHSEPSSQLRTHSLIP